MRWLALILLAIAMPLQADIPRLAQQHELQMTRIARSVWGMDAPLATLGAQIEQESGWRRGVSSAYAGGIAQFTPAQAQTMARLYPELRPVNVFSIDWAFLAQALYMRDLLEQFRAFNRCELFAKALASYNQGPGWTRRQEARSDLPQFWFGGLEFINPGKSHANFLETQGYVRRILLRLEGQYVLAGWGVGVCQ